MHRSCHSFCSRGTAGTAAYTPVRRVWTGTASHPSFGVGPRRPNRSKQGTEWARAVRRLGVLVSMGGKANCLCLRGIWETPKPRYREETKPVLKLPGTTFMPSARYGFH